MPKMKTVSKDKFYARIFRQEHNATQIGFTTVRFTDNKDKLLGIVVFHDTGNTYLLK